MEVSRLPISASHRGKLISAGYTSLSSLSSLSPSDIARDLKISESEAFEILKVASHNGRSDSTNGNHAIVHGGQTAWDMLHEEELLACITTSCSDLDSILGGGINCKEVTEIGGVPGIGKTQLGIQLAVNVQIPVDYGGLGGKAIYIVLSLVKDAAARLPASIGTKADIYTLICKRARSTCSSCFLLVRISLACDPCIRHDRDLQLWVYLHGEREDDEFEDHGPCPSKNRQVQGMQREGEVHQGR